MTELIDIAKLKRGDDQAFTLLMDQYAGLVFNLAYNFLQNKKDAEDVTQEVFTSVFLNIHKFKGDSKLSTWIYRIAVNQCQEVIRSKSRKKRFGFMQTLEKSEAAKQTATFDHPGIAIENKERAAALFGALEQLPENQRMAYTLNKIEGFSYEEITATMELSLSAVESLLFRAKQNLKKLLSTYYDENER